MADTSLVSRVKLQLELGEIMAKNIAKTARRQLGGRHLLFGEYLRSWTTPSSISMILHKILKPHSLTVLLFIQFLVYIYIICNYT